jgi:AcrR family transcriptional regulator
VARPKNSTRDTRGEMLEAAIRIIEDGGEQSLRTRVIADAVGVTEPSLFHFFGNREGLIEAAQAERYRRTQFEMFVPFRDAILACKTKRDFVKTVKEGLRWTEESRRIKARQLRVEVLASAYSRPKLAEQVIEAQRECLLPLIEGLEFAKAKKWVPADIDTEAVAFWHIGQITGRVFAELDGDPELFAAVGKLVQQASMSMLGLE